MTNKKAPPRTFKGLLLEMKLSVNYEERILAEELLVKLFEEMRERAEKAEKNNKNLAQQALFTSMESLVVGFGQEQAKVWKQSIEKPLLERIEKLRAAFVAIRHDWGTDACDGNTLIAHEALAEDDKMRGEK